MEDNHETLAERKTLDVHCEQKLLESSFVQWKQTEANLRRRFWTIIKTWYMVVFHLLASIGLALSLIFAVDGYNALDGTSVPRFSRGKLTLRSGDITGLISAGLVVVDFAVNSWVATVLMQCVFAELEKPGLTFAQFNRLVTWKIPLLNYSRRGLTVLLILLLTFPQTYMDPLLTGAVNWGAAFEEVRTVPVASGNPGEDYTLWGWYGSKLQDRQAAVRRAAGMANLAWATTNGSTVSGAAQKRCRHVVNDDQLPVNSRLDNVTIPCMVFNSISWPSVPTDSVSDAIVSVADDSQQLSLTATTPFSFVNYPGNAVLFDPSNTTLQLPFNNSLVNQGFDDLEDPIYPTSFLFSGTMAVIVLLAKSYIDAPYFIDGFGYSQPNNNFSTSSSFGQLDFTYLEVNVTIGVTTASSSTYLSSQVVEGAQDPQESDIVAGPWVHEALYLLPDVMSMVAIMNSTSLDTWDNLFNYTENLVRYSYQGAWDMLQRSFDPNTTTLVGTIVDARVQASVSHVRVYVWLGLSLLLTASSLPLLWLLAECNRNIVVDAPLALLLTDPTGVFDKDERNAEDNHHLSNLASTTGKGEGIKMELHEMPKKSGKFKLA